MTYAQPIRPIATKRPNGRIAVYISSGAWEMPHEAALSLFQQLGVALGLPTSEGVARFAARVLRWHRNDGYPGDVDGGDIQECALENDLLEVFERGRDICGENCECDEGDRCYRYSPLGRALMQLLDNEPTTAEVRL